jgi:hypothetical protein
MNCRLLTLAILFPILALDAQNRPRRGGGGFDVGLTLVRAADSNRSGDVTAVEWKAFLASVYVDPKKGIDGKQLMARILLPQLDRNADGEVKSLDLDRMFVSRDADKNAVLSSDEIRRRGGIMDTVVLMNADTNGDGLIGSTEWTNFLTQVKASTGITIATVQTWIAKAAAPTDADRTAFTPGVMLMTLEAGLDPDKDGKVTRIDLGRIFSAVDKNNDGAVQKDELVLRRGGRARMAPVTVEDRAKPALMPWQRSLEDALALVKKTGKPLLICVNMAGEPASESLAWKRYRDPEFVALASGFIPLLVSPDRQSVLDHGDRGKRIVDTRFGRLVCAEYIDHEPEIFAKYFNGRRVAPRHVGIDKDGKLLFDVYLATDLALIDAALEKHGRRGGATASADRSENGLLGSPDAMDRVALEQMFQDGDVATRQRLTAKSLSGQRAVQHPEVLRLALFKKNKAVLASAVETVTANVSRTPADLFYRVLDLGHDDPVVIDGIVRAVHAWATTEGLSTDDEKRAKFAQRIISGLQSSSRILDVRRWRGQIASGRTVIQSPPDASELKALDGRLDELEKLLRQTPNDRGLRLSMAATAMRYARIRILQGKDPTLLLQDVRSASLKATSADKPNGLALAHLAVACHLLREPATIDHAVKALLTLAQEPYRAASNIGAEVLYIFAQERMRVMFAAMRGGQEWPTSWFADVRAAYEVLLDHPAGTEKHALDYARFAGSLRLWGMQWSVLGRALVRFPTSVELHASFRTFCILHRGAEGLERSYLQWIRVTKSTPTKLWFAGLATLMSAERRVLNRMPKAALATYARSIASFNRSMRDDPTFEDTSRHYVCLCHAGIAHLKASAGDVEGALASVKSAIAARPNSLKSRNGLGRTPLQTAMALLPKLDSKKAQDLRLALQRAGVLSGTPR